ncbi:MULTISPECIES: DUF1090 domain-containing protein [unclassified Bordetella]|uniref:DUF1090 domain-containing protein n=1 Tax=unclassified Bordetella TaxID=2630031 RepID=UPI001328ECE4|nr:MULTISPECIES: DUF1090 domain-containing protein [unclassified Bordetella]MVW71348.1 DUF1090 family protein [Bordetella sp. 15P40C-2]MVW79430.1 DUF1090 family protein [Bordetella sp. 02P26C-1]
MIRTPRLVLILAGTLLTGSAIATEPPPSALRDCSAKLGCAAKFCHIENRIAAAQANGNAPQEKGLRRALAKARQACTDETLEADRQKAIEEAQAKVAEREEELAEARDRGSEEKIKRAQRKLQEARAELSAAQAELLQ